MDQKSAVETALFNHVVELSVRMANGNCVSLVDGNGHIDPVQNWQLLIN